MTDPAVQRTADRETIRRAIRAANDAHVPGDQQWDAHLADAVLAVLVPAELIRAEALEEFAEKWAEQDGIEALMFAQDDVAAVRLTEKALLARAAEYRKKAGAA